MHATDLVLAKGYEVDWDTRRPSRFWYIIRARGVISKRTNSTIVGAGENIQTAVDEIETRIKKET